jgi:putative mRNA 3-end processing factor
MNEYPIEVSPSGAVLLGREVCCDGFHVDSGARVQTHIHVDHMDDFDTSKGFQQIFMSEPTMRLLFADFNADLPFRSNIHALEASAPCEFQGCHVELLPNSHMLGSVQVAVALPKGMKLGYSGDFQWPLDNAIQVDALVVDSTYGGAECIREYSQAEVERRFLELVVSQQKKGPVHILAHRGTLQRALQILPSATDCPIVGTPRLCKEVQVYRDFGYGIGHILSADDAEGKRAISQGRFIRFYGLGDGSPVETRTGTTISLSAFMSRPDDPVLEYSERSYRVALSNHADFNGTLEYVRATGAKYVVTDNTRGGHALELALEIRSRLGIEARPSSLEFSREWGV